MGTFSSSSPPTLLHYLQSPSHFLPVSQLAEPGEGLGVLHLLYNHLLYHVTSMDVNGTDSHDTLAAGLSHVTQ